MNKEIKPEAPGKGRSGGEPDWRFHTYRRKQLGLLARHVPCRIEELEDRYDEGRLLGVAHGTNLEKRLHIQFGWSKEKIERVLAHLCRIT